MEDLNLVMRERLQKAQELERAEIALFPNSYAVPHQIGTLSGNTAIRTPKSWNRTRRRL